MRVKGKGGGWGGGNERDSFQCGDVVVIVEGSNSWMSSWWECTEPGDLTTL